MMILTTKKLQHDLRNIIAALSTVSRRIAGSEDERLVAILSDTIVKLSEIANAADATVEIPGGES